MPLIVYYKFNRLVQCCTSSAVSYIADVVFVVLEAAGRVFFLSLYWRVKPQNKQVEYRFDEY